MNEIYSDSSYVFISKFVPKIPVPISPSIPKSRIPEANDPESRKSGFGTGISGLSGFPISRPTNTTSGAMGKMHLPSLGSQKNRTDFKSINF